MEAIRKLVINATRGGDRRQPPTYTASRMRKVENDVVEERLAGKASYLVKTLRPGGSYFGGVHRVPYRNSVIMSQRSKNLTGFGIPDTIEYRRDVL